MPYLSQSLQSQDLGQLHIIADQWGIDFQAPSARQGRKQLSAQLLNRELITEVVDSLPADVKAGLSEMLENNGRLLWAQFARSYGSVREMGASKRDREKPHLKPETVSERLWYLAMMGRAFFDTADGPQEFAYIPEDLADLISISLPEQKPAMSQPASPSERKQPTSVNDAILDDACTLLAALRLGFGEDEIKEISAGWRIPASQLRALLQTAELIDDNGQPAADKVQSFLQASRGEALLELAEAWRSRDTYNELLMIPHLQTEGGWQNQPLQTRGRVMEMISDLDQDTWWSLSSFIETVYRNQPGFQRPNEDFESWYIKDQRTDKYLRGIEHWDEVEGELLRFMIAGPLHWLGFLDTASPEKGTAPTAFRLSKWRSTLMEGKPPPKLPKENKKLQVNSNLEIAIPRLVERAIRYQVSRFCSWDGQKQGQYIYHPTPESLQNAQEQGLQVKHLLTLLQKSSETKLPPNLSEALKQWESQGTQAFLETKLVLRVRDPEILQALKSSKASRFLGDVLGPTTVEVKAGAGDKISQALNEMGYLSDLNDLGN